MSAIEKRTASAIPDPTRKERTLRFRFFHRSFPNTTYNAACAAVVAILAASALSLLTGCDGMSPRQLDPNRGWLDPSELVAARHGPLRVPILNQPSPGIEEPNEVYAN